MSNSTHRSASYLTAPAAYHGWLALILLSFCLASQPGRANEGDDLGPLVKRFFPKADRFGDFDGDPRAAGVYKGGQLLGYVFFTDDVVRIPAYSGKPIKTLVGFDLQGTITGVKIIKHEEPILVIGVTDQDLTNYINQYKGKSLTDRVKIGSRQREGYVNVDGISGATITVMVLNRSIMVAAKKVAASRGFLGGKAPKQKTASDAEALEIAAEIDPPLDPLWTYAWYEKRIQIVVLAIGLVFLTLVLVFQDLIARHPSPLFYIRNGFLLYTLFFIGLYSLAQLSVVNVLTFLHSVMHGFSWDSFMIDPLMFILWGFVAVTLILWGRGVYCGWLCPFGAFQELSYKVARKLGIPAYEFPRMVHERLWALKYVLLIMLFGISLGSLENALRFSEIEPFKTAVTLRFQREWVFVAYAGGLLVVALFIRKFFCRYLCPLGAALTFPARFRIFDWLRRHRECGRPCQTCATECEVGAISRDGRINENECHYCLDCQVTYWNAYRCPPLAERRKRRERRDRVRRSSASARAQAKGSKESTGVGVQVVRPGGQRGSQ